MSAAPGWYADPDGTPGRVRYWNGQVWTDQVRASGGYAAGGSSGQAKGIPPVAVILGIIALLLVAALVVWQVLRSRGSEIGTDTNSSTPTVSAWNESTSPTPSPSGADKVDCPTGTPTLPQRLENGRRIGGGLSFQSRGWEQGGFSMRFTKDVSSERREIMPFWQSNLSVGALAVADGFDEPRKAATMMLQCFATSAYYRALTGVKIVSSEKGALQGHQGYRIVADVLVSDPAAAKGDRVTIYVIDTGNPESLGFFLSAATISDPTNLNEVAETEKTLKVES